MSLSFVFIYIPGSLVDFSSQVAQRWAHFALLCGLSSRRVFGGCLWPLPRRAGKSSTGVDPSTYCHCPLFSYTFSLCSPKNISQQSALTSSHAIPGWRKPYCVGLRCPGGTGQAERRNLTELRLRRIADVQRQRLRQPSTSLPSPLFS